MTELPKMIPSNQNTAEYSHCNLDPEKTQAKRRRKKRTYEERKSGKRKAMDT